MVDGLLAFFFPKPLVRVERQVIHLRHRSEFFFPEALSTSVVGHLLPLAVCTRTQSRPNPKSPNEYPALLPVVIEAELLQTCAIDGQ